MDDLKQLLPNDSVEEPRRGNSMELSRRKILSGTAVTGTILLGMGSASANGQGGQAVVRESDYEPDNRFVIYEVDECPEGAGNPDGSCWLPTLHFQCKGEGGRNPPGKGGTLPFPYWNFNYVDEFSDLDDLALKENAQPRKLYTRDNKVRTGIVYRWPGNEKLCEGAYRIDQEDPEPADAIQTGFSSVKENK